jgi:MFS family permease
LAGNDTREKQLAWSPLGYPIYRAFWVAALISSIGTWLQTTAVAWLMTTISHSALVVALVQTATSLPLFLLALPAGALADRIDRPRLIIITHVWMFAIAIILGLLTIAGMMTPWLLLALTFMLGLGGAMSAPATEALLPELVPRPEIPKAVALNSTGFDLSRSVGPALGGVLVGLAGAGITFFCDAVTYLGIILVLYFWKRTPRENHLTPEPMGEAMRTGARFIYYSPALGVTLIHVAAFTLCASVLLSLRPLFVQRVLGLGSMGYGLMFACFGLGSLIGTTTLPWIQARLSLDMLFFCSTALFSATIRSEERV